MNFIVRLPTWKVYLYTLGQRIKLFKKLLIGRINLGFTKKEKYKLKSMIHQYLPKGVIKRQTKPFIYEALVDSIYKNINFVTKEELEIANKLLWIKQLNLKEIIMEIKTLKGFGKEVGIDAKTLLTIKDENELITLILKNVDPTINYSPEFVAWYDSLPDEFFDNVEAVSGAAPVNATTGEVTGINVEEVIELINSLSKRDELLQIVNDNDMSFYFTGLDVDKYKLPTLLKKEMIKMLETVKSEETTKSTDGGIDVNDLIEIINQVKNEDDLVAVLSDEAVEPLFEGQLEIGDTIDVEAIKAQMLTILGVEPEKTKPLSLKEKILANKAKTTTTSKKPSLKGSATTTKDDSVIPFDHSNFDLEDIYNKADALPFPSLRKFAKEIEIVASPGTKKDDLLTMIAEKLTEMAEGKGVSIKEDTSELEITKEMVEEFVKADDKDSLIACAEALNIQLNALTKMKASLIANKLFEVVKPASETKQQGSEPVAGSENQSIYHLMTEMVQAGKTEAEIEQAVTPFYKGKGKQLLFIKKRVKGMIEIIKADFDIK